MQSTTIHWPIHATKPIKTTTTIIKQEAQLLLGGADRTILLSVLACVEYFIYLFNIKIYFRLSKREETVSTNIAPLIQLCRSPWTQRSTVLVSDWPYARFHTKTRFRV